jgi:hypothetical protein
MNLRAYSSVTAFMAHYVALRTARSDGTGAPREKPPHPDDAATLIEMERIIGELSTADRDALHNEASSPADTIPSGAVARHRARAELKLYRLLAARGLLTG